VIFLNYFEPIIIISVTVPIAFFIGYKLRPVIPKRKRLIIGFIIAFATLTILLGIDLSLPTINISKTAIGIAIAVGFPLGLAGPPYKDNK